LQEPVGEPQLIIRTICLSHCKRGPDACEECRELETPMICLLAMYAPGEGDAQRRTIGVVREGQQAWFEYDILLRFETQMEATRYAEEHGLEDVQF
jgi:hypothetical protein